MSDYRIIQGDVLAKLAELPDESVHCVVTSPPYWGLRDYNAKGQIGLEKTPAEFIAKMVQVFREVRRVLRSDGTCWVNMGDSYSSQPNQRVQKDEGRDDVAGWKQATNNGSCGVGSRSVPGLKPKDLCGMPWRLAFALQDDGWWLRQDIIWSKPNPMPESVVDRCTKAHEYIFLLTKSARYFYDAEAVKEPASGTAHARGNGVNPKSVSGWASGTGPHTAVGHNTAGVHPKTPGKNSRIHVDRDPTHLLKAKRPRQNESFSAAVNGLVDFRNKRSVWEIASEPYAEAHFATFPTKLVEPCIRAGCPPGGTVLDPFNGSGTTGLVALAERCRYIGIELNPEYVAMAERRLSAATAQGVLL